MSETIFISFINKSSTHGDENPQLSSDPCQNPNHNKENGLLSLVTLQKEPFQWKGEFLCVIHDRNNTYPTVLEQ